MPYITTDDNQKIYFDHHKNSGPLLVFLHGLGGDLNAWKEERERLHILGYSTLAIDIRGHGLSGRPPQLTDYTIDLIVKDVVGIFKHENIHQATIIGHCFGGMVAMSFVAMHPELSSCLILIDTGYKQPRFARYITDNEFIADMIKKIIPYLPKSHIQGRRDFSKFIDTGDWNVNRIARDILHISLRSYFMLGRHVSEFNGSALLSRIHVPTLIIEGTHDSIFPPEMAEALHNRIISSELEYIPNANHILITNNPNEVSESISKFIRKLDII